MPIPLDTLLTAMVGVHVLIGLGEAVITFLVVASIVVGPPGPRPRRAPRARRTRARDPGRRMTTHAAHPRVSTRTVLVVGLLVALVLAGVVSFYASASPDGLNRVAGDLGFAGAEQASGTQDGPLAGYEVAGLDSPLVRRRSPVSSGAWSCSRCTSALMLLRRRVDASPYRRRRVTMGAPHGHRLHFHGHSPLHRAPAHLKVAGLVAFMLVVVATPVGLGPRLRGVRRRAGRAGRAVRRPGGLPRPADGRRDAGAGVRRAAALRRHRTRGRGARPVG